MPLVDHSKNSSSFLDSKHFVCSTCKKCVFNANHDNCITNFLKEVNSRAKVQSLKTRNNNKPVEPKSHTQKSGRQIAIRQRFSFNKSSAVHEKPNTPRSCLRWIPTGRIFKLVGLRWIPTGKMFIDSTTKVDSEPPNGSNEDITNLYECDQTLNVSAGLVPQSPSPTPNVPPTKNDWDSLFCPMFDEYFNPSPSVVQPVLVAGVQEPVVSTGTPSSTRIDQDTPSTSTSQTTQEEQSHVIPTSVEEDNHVNQPQEHIEKWTKDHPLDKIIGDPSRPVSTRLQLQTEALFCYYDALLSSSEHKSYKDALTESCWIDAMKSSMSSSEGSGITPEVPDEPKDNSAVVAEKQAGYVQTNLTLSSAELEIQSMVDVPIHQEDLVVQRTPLIDPVISMVTEKTTSTPTPPITQAHVAKYQRYLTEEVFSDDEAPATKPAKGAKPKTTRKPKLQSPKTTPVVKPTASKISKSTSSQPPKPKPAPVKPQEKKRNLVLDAAEAPSQAKHSKVGKVLKKRKLQSTLQLVDEFVDEGIPADEPRFGDEEADMCKAVEEILKDAYVAPRGSLPQVVIREPEPGKYEPLLEVQGKGKENVGEEQAAQVLLNLMTETESDNEASREGQVGLDPEKSQEHEPEKTNTEVEVQSMVTVPIHQDTSSSRGKSNPGGKPPATHLHQRTLYSQTGDIGGFIDWFCKKQGITELTTEHLEGPAYEVVNAFHPDVIHLQFQRRNVQAFDHQTEFFFNKDLEYLRFGNKGDRLALSITKIKAAHYPDAGLKQMVPDQMWIEEECMYDILATYGISYWWFKRYKFYINRHSADTNRRASVRTHMRILSVVRIEVFSIYGYDYMKKIILQRADNQEYTIAENDFKDLYPSDFEDLYLLNLQGHLNHLPPRDKKILSTAVNLWIRNLVIRKRVEDFQLGIESYQTQLNLTKPRWEATGLEFMHDYKILDSPRAVLFRDKYGMQMLMRFNEIHKFSDGTLQQINEAFGLS
ncbi:hypothetical protein Tco_1108649 [Tanacetum coccineum]